MPSDRSLYRRPVWANWRAGYTGELPVSVATGQAWRNALANLRYWRRNGTLIAYSGAPDPATNDDGDAECARLYCAVAGGARIEEGTAPRHVCVSEAIYRHTHYDAENVTEGGLPLEAGTIGISWAGPWDANGLDAATMTVASPRASIPLHCAVDRNGVIAVSYFAKHCIDIYDPPTTWGGTYTLRGTMGKFNAAGSGMGALSSQYDVKLDGKYAYIADLNNNRIQRWEYSPAVAAAADLSLAMTGAAYLTIPPQTVDGVGVGWANGTGTGGVASQFDVSTMTATGLTVTTGLAYLYDDGQGRLWRRSSRYILIYSYAGATLMNWTASAGSGRDQISTALGNIVGDHLQRVYLIDATNRRVVAREMDAWTSPWTNPRWISDWAISYNSQCAAVTPHGGGYLLFSPSSSNLNSVDMTHGRNTQPIEFMVDPGSEVTPTDPSETSHSHDERHHTRDIVPAPDGSRRLEYHAPTDDTVVLGCVEWRRRVNSAITVSTAAHDLPASTTATDYDDEIESPSVLPGGLIKMTSDSMGGLILRIGAGSTVTVNRPATAELDTRRIWQVGHPTGIKRTGAGRLAVFGAGTVNDPHWRHKIRPRALTATTATTTAVQPFVVILYATAGDIFYCSSKSGADSTSVTLGSGITVPTLVPLDTTLDVDGGGDELIWEWDVAASTIAATFGAYEMPAW